MRREGHDAGVPPLTVRATAAPPEVEEEQDLERVLDDAPVAQNPWVTVVWNDPVNLMSYVVFVFQDYFKHPRKKAEKLMMEVHEEGRSTVSSGTREEMERDVQAMHGYGLWATLQKADA